MNERIADRTVRTIIGEHRLYRVEVWNVAFEQEAFTVYIFAPFLSCAMKEAFKVFRASTNLYPRTIAPCDCAEVIRVLEEEPQRIMTYHPETDEGFFRDIKKKRRAKMNN